MAWSTPIVAPPDGAMSDYMASLEKLGRRAETCIFPAMAVRAGRRRVSCSSTAAHRRAREASILNGWR